MWRQALQRHGEGAVFVRASKLQKLVAGQHQLADQGHQVFQHVDRDADGLGAGGLPLPGAARGVGMRWSGARGTGADARRR